MTMKSLIAAGGSFLGNGGGLAVLIGAAVGDWIRGRTGAVIGGAIMLVVGALLVRWNEVVGERRQAEEHVKWLAEAPQREAERKQREAEEAAQRAARRAALKRWDTWKRMAPREFEEACADLLRQHGYTNVRVTSYVSDGGIDVVAMQGTDRFAVQCKRYRGQVGPSVIRELAGVIAMGGEYAGGIIMTPGTFSPAAVTEAARTTIQLVDGYTIMAWTDATSTGAEGR
jgi:restriction endonuclease Mrr